MDGPARFIYAWQAPMGITLMTYIMKAIASVWIGTLKCFRVHDDREAIAAHAVMSLKASIDHLKRQEDDMTRDLAVVIGEIRTKRAKTSDKAAVRALLIKSKQKRSKLTQVVKKRESFEHHLDVLSNTEMDQELISTVKKTASAMKSLGLNKTIDDVDNIMADLEETQLDMKEVTNIMSSRVAYDDELDDKDLEDELDMIMGMDTENMDSTSLVVKESGRKKEMPTEMLTETPQVKTSMKENEEEFSTVLLAPAVPS